MSEVNQFERVCRTCLTREISDDNCNSLYKVIDLENGDSREISKIIDYCVNLQVTKSDRLPQIICFKCISLIRNFYEFREKCHKNDKYLRDQVDGWKIKSEIKIENVGQHFLDVAQEINVQPITESERTLDDKLEINIFENVSDDRISCDSSSDYDDDSKDSDFKLEITENASEPSKKAQHAGPSSNDQHLVGEKVRGGQQITLHKCDICFVMCDNRKDLVFHRRTNHINEISEEYYTTVKKDNKTHYICTLCNRFCKHKDTLRVHLRSHTGEKPYKCAVCPSSFAQKGHCRKHMRTHKLETFEKKPAIFYKCGLCEEGFESEVAVKIHYEEFHPVIQEKDKARVEKLCQLCGKFIKDLPEHLRLHAGMTNKKHTCKICGQILGSSSSLSKHKQRHSDEKKFVCDTCGKGFKTKPDLTLHRKIHSEERKHECQLCGRKFLHNNRLRIHLKVHAGEKPYQVYDDRKKERRRLQRLELIKSGKSLEKPKPRKNKEKIGTKQIKNLKLPDRCTQK